MVTIVASVIALVGGVVAGLVPALAVSERRRLVRFIREEAGAIKELDDPEAQAVMVHALRASTVRYRSLASMTKLDRLSRQAVMLRPISTVFLAMGLVLTALTFSPWFDMTDDDSKYPRGLGLGLSALGVVFLLVMALRVNVALRDEGRDLEREIARREFAESAMDEVDLTLQEWERDLLDGDGDGSTEGDRKTSGEVVDLLAALQRSVDAAKEARGETSETGPRGGKRKFYGGGEPIEVHPSSNIPQGEGIGLAPQPEAEEVRRRWEKKPDFEHDGEDGPR